MSNPRCAVCSDVNRLGAEVCEMCGARLDESAADSVAGGPSYYYGEEPRAGALPTDIPSPHFQGAGDIIGPTLELYRKHFPLVGMLVLATTIPLAVLEYGTYYAFASGGEETADIFPITGSGMVFASGATGLFFYGLVSLVLNSMLAGALVYAVVEVQRAGEARVLDCLRWGAEKLPKVAAVYIIYYLIIYVFPVFMLGVAGFALGGFALLVLLASILPWVVASLMFSLVVPAAVAENRGVVESFKRSRDLTEGHKGLIFLTYFLWALITTVVSLVITFSFAARGGGWSAATVILQTLVSELLKSTTYVLTTYMFLGILNERRQGFAARAAAPAAP